MEFYSVSWLNLVSIAVLVAMSPYILFLGISGFITLGRRRPQPEIESKQAAVTFAVVIPAHNEGLSIGRTIASLQRVEYPADRLQIIVVADNCDDDTAMIARSAGVFVLERRDEKRRSKGHALADVLPRILGDQKFTAVQAVVVVDADTLVDPQALRALQAPLLGGGRWIQGLDVVANEMESWRTKLMAFGFALFNGTFQIGTQFITGSAHLRGNGMCFSREALERVPWQAGGLAEDLEFSWRLRLAGESVQFIPTAIFRAEMPISGRVSVSQRRRWEKGRHGLWAQLRKPILQANAPKTRKILWAIDLTMPSFTTIVAWYLVSVMAFVASGFGVASLSRIANAILLASYGLFLGVYVLSPFLRFGLPWATLTALVQLPYYALWRTVIALGRAPRRWVRTERR
ncbi:MAG: glycosyltransferase [Deltaproteobacteria bacterium]|nr:glycosyltransferase [Deltaproteobacteria bacterium]